MNARVHAPLLCGRLVLAPLGLTQRPERALEMQLAFFGLAHHAGEVAACTAQEIPRRLGRDDRDRQGRVLAAENGRLPPRGAMLADPVAAGELQE